MMTSLTTNLIFSEVIEIKQLLKKIKVVVHYWLLRKILTQFIVYVTVNEVNFLISNVYFPPLTKAEENSRYFNLINYSITKYKSNKIILLGDFIIPGYVWNFHNPVEKVVEIELTFPLTIWVELPQ